MKDKLDIEGLAARLASHAELGPGRPVCMIGNATELKGEENFIRREVGGDSNFQHLAACYKFARLY
jgi:hypothetical protein